MYLRQQIHTVIAADPRLQQLIGRDVTDSLDWNQVADDTHSGVLSAGEAALVRCLAGLAGAAVENFNEDFDRLDGRDQEIICKMMVTVTNATISAEKAGLEVTQQ